MGGKVSNGGRNRKTARSAGHIVYSQASTVVWEETFFTYFISLK